jgi:UDP-N-acetylmuramoyl-tripeptide--D-alanyl-D-alanine ligase
MVAAILGQRYEVLKNKGNFNNLIGVPLTILSIEPQHQAAIVEMGINVPGEMARLVEIAGPTVGLITNVQPAHLEGLHSLDEILQEKGKLWLSLGPEDLAVVNLDDERLAGFSKEVRARTVTYSLKKAGGDVRLSGEVVTDGGASAFAMNLGDQSISVRLPVLGLHHVGNALAAAAVGWGMGLPAELIAAGLMHYQPIKMRMQMHRLADGRILIDDAYNANPGSMLAAVRTVTLESRGKPVVAVLGDMRELGPESAALHREVGRQIASLGVSQLITLGQMTLELADEARQVGLPASAHRHAESHGEIVTWLKNHELKDAWILVKGSRGMTMERVVEGILSQ